MLEGQAIPQLLIIIYKKKAKTRKINLINQLYTGLICTNVTEDITSLK